ncbi:TetR family transcriptional regulator [Pseudomonas shirazensis]|jgi:TetR/AcrR family acrAB operon transcriptional repressor|uniref:TetR family transcriptional regulator n=3 Tax=Pseudomonas TaxID=286 RepID=A0A2S3WI02_PSEPU|nr:MULTISPECIES: TetR family transcriptional regulator [Gammaproteobacteria]AUF97767.1 TetR family transcriptional regulator [Pseudomonas sp. 02C 26]MBA1198094.1 TetR family transcriptional regulator [Pseudomonas plecoglossicida]MBV4503206.1 TetR family transcriptional regulator [Pseudomonas shirazensis]MCS4285001.1 TetR/AcrR family acrAB operon transcriptional repressor [Pseudomonas sp. BIGb0278]POF90573.1 TetR family transcriptional regulator [Pseudomonas putida]
MVRRTKEEAQETRAQIVAAAERAFYKRGVARTTLADIAQQAGVTRGAIYWHFSNKAELVQALLDSVHESHDHLARASESEDELDPLGCMRTLLLQVLNDLVLDARTRRINEILHHKCEFTDEMCEIRQQRQGAIADCHQSIVLALGNAVRREQLPADLLVDHAAVAIFAYIDGLIGRWLLLPDSFDLLGNAERWVDTGLDMLRLSPALRK